MCTIRLSEVLYGKDYPEAGASLYEIIMQNKDSADKIVISMEGVSSIPSMFLNVSIGRYIEEFGIESLRSKISFSKITKAQAVRLRDYIDKMSKH